MFERTNWKPCFEAVKDECRGGLWSKGVKLARDGRVAGQEREDDEWTFRVSSVGTGVVPTIRLYPDDTEWECDCGGHFDPCEHIAACVIAVTADADAANELFDAEKRNLGIRYVLDRQSDGVVVHRFVAAQSGDWRELTRPLSEELTTGGATADIAPTHEDLRIDKLIGKAVHSPLPIDRVNTLLRALVNVSDVRIGDDPVSASSEPLFPDAYVTDAGQNGVKLVIEANDPEVSVFVPGILRRGPRLHPFGAQGRFGHAWEKLPFRKTFSKSEIPELAGTMLPELEKYITVDIRTSRLPRKQEHIPVWIQFNIDLVNKGVDVLPLLVYGDPPVVRVDAGQMVTLGDVVPIRNEARENELRLRLRDRLNLVPGRRVHIEGTDAAKFLSDLEDFDDGRPRAAKLSQRSDVGAQILEPRLEQDSETGDLEIRFGAEGQTVEAKSVINAWQNGIGLVPLSAGSFARIPDTWLQDHGHLVAELVAARDLNDGRLPKPALPALGELCDILDTAEPPGLENFRQLLDTLPTEATTHARPADAIAAELCPEFGGELRGYQADGVAWLARLRDAGLGAILADDMGLGKTIQALCVLRGRSLIVCPRSVIHNWTKEIERFRPDLSVCLYHGPGRSLDDAEVTLTTYATLRNDADLLINEEWDAIVLDESQAIKNPGSQVARAAYQLNARFRLTLSGTPIENRLDELWSQLHFTNRGLLGGRKDFSRLYEGPIHSGDEATLERLRSRVKPFLLRRLKKEVATELPPRTDSILYCELDDEERRAYDAVKAASRKDIVDQLGQTSVKGGSVLLALEALLRLRQAACHRGLLPGMEAPSSSKLDALCEALEDAVADGHKALVFSQWTSLLDKVEPQLQERSLPYVRLDGSTRDRASVVESFQAASGPPVMIISLKAGGTGLNLTAADHVFLLDPWWNPAVEDQAADRAHRIGQDRPVMVYRMVAKDTVEERVLELQRRKKELAQAALSDAGAGGGALTRDDILALLE